VLSLRGFGSRLQQIGNNPALYHHQRRRNSHPHRTISGDKTFAQRHNGIRFNPSRGIWQLRRHTGQLLRQTGNTYSGRFDADRSYRPADSPSERNTLKRSWATKPGFACSTTSKRGKAWATARTASKRAGDNAASNASFWFQQTGQRIPYLNHPGQRSNGSSVFRLQQHIPGCGVVNFRRYEPS